jgi:hypothetical protein
MPTQTRPNRPSWKMQETDSLEWYYQNNDAGSAWGHLPEKPPQIKEEGVVYYTKRELTFDLLKEQGFICAYCNRVIHNNEVERGARLDFIDRKCSVEHISGSEE